MNNPQLEQACNDLQAGRITEEQFRQSLKDLGVPAEISERYLTERTTGAIDGETAPGIGQLLAMVKPLLVDQTHKNAAMKITELAAKTGKPVSEIFGLYQESLELLTQKPSAEEE